MSLAQKISRRIIKDGPISLANYMEIALADPEFGYYITRLPFGTHGDFTTSPEISQIFGELIGLWCAAFWLQIGSPQRLNLVELGPGRGTLMADALRAAKSVPGFAQALQVHLVEISPKLRKIQTETLKNSGHSIHWHTQLDGVPDGPAIFIANEFFDALPIHQFIQTKTGWCERLVAVNTPEKFEFTISPNPTPPEKTGVSPLLAASPADSLVETCPLAVEIIKTISKRIQTIGGAALIIDYGYEKPGIGETLQAVSKHKYADVLQAPGKQDLTAHVNFSALAQAARHTGVDVFGPLSQGQFLFGLGLEARLARLTNATTRAQAYDIKRAAARLTAPEQMGTLFKVMAITKKNGSPPAPFT